MCSSDLSSAGICSCFIEAQTPILVRSSKTSTLPKVLPSKSILPWVGKISVAKSFKRVDLPAPFGPKTTQRSPSEIVNEIGPKISLPERFTLAFSIDATWATVGKITLRGSLKLDNERESNRFGFNHR